MSIAFESISNSIRSPIVAVELGASDQQQGPQIQKYRGLLIGQKTTGSAVAELTRKTATTADQVGSWFGYDSQLYWLAKSWFQNNKVTELDVVAIDDPSGGTASQGSFAITGTATAGGTLYAYVGGKRYQVAVASGDSATTVGAALAAAIQADVEAPVAAANTTGTVTCTAINLGVDGDDIDLRVNYAAGEVLPAGISVAVTAMGGVTAGTGSCDITEVWPLIVNDHYNVLGVGFADQTTLSALNTELADRWGPQRMMEGVAIVGARGNQSTLTTLGNANNSPHLVIIGANASPTPPWSWAGALAGVVARYGQSDPARPFQSLPLVGVLAPDSADVFSFAENEILLTDGVATFGVSQDGTVRVARTVTTYQTNPSTGGPDATFLDVQTPLTLGYIRYDARLSWGNKFGRHKLADDSRSYDAGQYVVTPGTARAFFLGKFREWEGLGLVEGFDQFKADLQVDRNGLDRNRLDVYLPPDLINQLRVTAIRIAFLL